MPSNHNAGGFVMSCIICGKRTNRSTEVVCSDKCLNIWKKRITKEIDNLPKTKDWSKSLELDWDKWACTADWHCPFYHKGALKSLIKTCADKNIRNLVIGGDYFNLDAFSKFFGYSKVPWKEEKRVAKKIMKILRQQFDNIAFIVANHEERWLKSRSEGEGDILDIYEIIDVPNLELVTVHSFITVQDWLITHPKNARKNPLSLARDLSTVYRNRNIVVTHAHMQGMCSDPSGNHWLVDLGMMGDPDKFEYKNVSITTHYNWNVGFMTVEQGHPTMYKF